MLFAYSSYGRELQPLTTEPAALVSTWLIFCPPKYALALSTNAGSLRSAVVAGKPPLARNGFTPSSWFSHRTNAAASAGLALCFSTDSVLPPFSAVAGWPSYVGIGATAHLPAPALTEASITPGIQAPVGRVAIVPSPSALNHSSVQPGMFDTRPPSTSWFQVPVHFFEPSSCRLFARFLPSVLNGWPPACQIMLVVKPASPASLVM